MFNTRICIECHKEIPALHKRCPYCRVFQQPYAFYNRMSSIKRNKTIIEKLDSGRYTLKRLGEEYGITRERVRQIYKREMGRSHHEKRSEFLKHQSHLYRLRIIREKKKHVRFLCKECGKPVTEIDDKRLIATCRSCSRKYRKTERIPEKITICLFCHKEFHPYRGTPHQKFCTKQCYFDYCRKFGRPVYRRRSRISSIPIESVSSILRINGKVFNNHA